MAIWIMKGSLIIPKKNGIGTEKYIDGSVYEGNFINEEKSGQGKYTFPNGEYYEGNFKNDLYEGEGDIKDNSILEKWKEMESVNIEMGQFIKKYVGRVKQGEGTYIWNNGQNFIGNWLNNELFGNGILTANENKYEVVYQFGKIISPRNIQRI